MSIELNEAQKNATELLVGELEETGHRKVIFLTGFTGCGKKTMLEAVSPEVQYLYGAVVTPTFLLDNRNHETIRENEGHYIVPVNPREGDKANRGVARVHPDYERVEVVVPGMSMPETITYVEQLRAGAHSRLTWPTGLIAEKSEGIYTFAKRILQGSPDRLIDYDIYADLKDQLPKHALTYSKFLEEARRYLGMDINNWVDGYARQYLDPNWVDPYQALFRKRF